MTEEEERIKFIKEIEEFWQLTHEYWEVLFWISIWIFIMIMWTYESVVSTTFSNVLGAIAFDSLGIFYIYHDIKKWKAIKLNTIRDNKKEA